MLYDDINDLIEYIESYEILNKICINNSDKIYFQHKIERIKKYLNNSDIEDVLSMNIDDYNLRHFEEGKEEGLDEGREEGKDDGILEGKIEILKNLKDFIYEEDIECMLNYLNILMLQYNIIKTKEEKEWKETLTHIIKKYDDGVKEN